MKKLSLFFCALAVSAMAMADDNKVAVLDGSVLTTTATTEVTTVTQDGIKYSMGSGVKYQTSTKATQHFVNNKSILLPKEKALNNVTAFGSSLIKLEVFANEGASKKAVVSIAYSATAFSAEPTVFDTTVALATVDCVYDMGVIPSGTRYIYLKNGKDANAQIQLRATYVPKVYEPTMVESIELENDGKDTIEVGDKLDLNKLYTIIPDTATDQRVEFSIESGSEYISLNNGVVNGLAAGDAQVKIVALDSLNLSAKKSATFSINVKAAKLNTCAEVNAAEKGDIIKLNAVTVVYANGSNNYVKDASGSTLIYKYNAGLKAGDNLVGVKGEVDLYNGLHQLKPTNDPSAWTISAGAAPEIPAALAAPTAAEVNQVLVWKGVKGMSGEFTTDAKTTIKGVFGTDSVAFFNNFKIAKSFVATNSYDITGAVAVYNTTIQVYFISAKDNGEVTALIDNKAEKSQAKKMMVNGQMVIVRDGKMYNALGAEL